MTHQARTLVDALAAPQESVRISARALGLIVLALVACTSAGTLSEPEGSATALAAFRYETYSKGSPRSLEPCGPSRWLAWSVSQASITARRIS